MTDYKKALIHLAETTDCGDTLINILCTLTGKCVYAQDVQDMSSDALLAAIKAAPMDGDAIGADWRWDTISSDPSDGIVHRDTLEIESDLNANHSGEFTSYHLSAGDDVKTIADEYHAWSSDFQACIAVYDADGSRLYACEQDKFSFQGGVTWTRGDNGLWSKTVS